MKKKQGFLGWINRVFQLRTLEEKAWERSVPLAWNWKVELTCVILQVWIFVCSQLYFDITLSSSEILSTLDVGIRFLISPWEFLCALTMWNLGRLTLPAECWDTKMGALKCEWPKLYVETPSIESLKSHTSRFQWILRFFRFWDVSCCIWIGHDWPFDGFEIPKQMPNGEAMSLPPAAHSTGRLGELPSTSAAGGDAVRLLIGCPRWAEVEMF